jgi:hypothetical protein
MAWILAHAGYDGEECLIWPFAVLANGYPRIGKKLATRVMCELINGAGRGTKYEAAHLCGNGHLGCINPKHLAWKTRKENEADKKPHGTIQNGERHWNSKLTAADVMKIRSLDIPQKDIAEMFGVGFGTIGKIIRRDRWRHI